MTFEEVFECNETGKETDIYCVYMRGARMLWDAFHDRCELKPASIAKAKQGKNRKVKLYDGGRCIAAADIGKTTTLYVPDMALRDALNLSFELSPQKEYRHTFENAEECVAALKSVL